jgi:hypothetical protein
MADVLFQQVLQFNQNQLFAPNQRGGQTSSSGKGKTTTTCATPPTPGTPGASTGPAFTPPAASPVPFLKGVITKEKEEVERLLKLAAKIGPVAQTVEEEETAYDAAFEAETPAPIPAYTDTLQGFTFVMFFFSYAALAIVMTVFINMTTGNAVSAAGALIGFIVFGAVIFALLKRFA